MTRTMLCFGDSNTHGTPPIPHAGASVPRHGPDLRWPRVAGRALGWDVLEEGLPGRTAQFDDPVMGAHMNGRVGLQIALATHGPIDVMTLMLGTNDVKGRFATTPAQVVAGIAGLLDMALQHEMQAKHGGFPVLLICPPPVVEVGPFAGEFRGGAALSRALPPLYASLAADRGCGFLDAGQVIVVSPVDGIHYDAAAHAALGAAVAQAVAALVPPHEDAVGMAALAASAAVAGL
jgi:lysophospholipase L1-like esterase